MLGRRGIAKSSDGVQAEEEATRVKNRVGGVKNRVGGAAGPAWQRGSRIAVAHSRTDAHNAP
jgi:hypothetical protein